MKKFLFLLIFVFSTTAFGQIDSTQFDKPKPNEKTTTPSGFSASTVISGIDGSVARVLDDEFARLGYSEPARLSILGDVGRENGWNREIIFKGHRDPKNKKFNRGIISWQGSRRKNLDAYLKQEGLLGRNDDEELRGMARFMNTELQDEYPEVYMDLLAAEDTASASNALQKYIKYVPKRPYNSPDANFKVKKNAKWAEKAIALGLGQTNELTETVAEVRTETETRSLVKAESDADAIAEAQVSP